MKNVLLIFALLLSVGIHAQAPFVCGVPERAPRPVSAALVAQTPDGVLCSRVFVQVGHDIVQDKGRDGAEVFVRALMKEVAVPYRDIDIELSFTYEFLEAPTYSDGDSGDLLRQFRIQKPTFDGDVAILLSYLSSGGIAFVNTACEQSSPFRYAFANIQPTFRPFREGYSWPPMVICHELGHAYGSSHTQDCVWNGNNTAIDGCYQGGGNCERGPIPKDGGTLLSYCHLNPVGINFDRGFHPQVAEVIRAGVYNRCLTCDRPDGEDGGDPPVVTCEENPLFINLILDAYPDETRYQLVNSAGDTIHRRGPFPRYAPDGSLMAGEVIADTLCLPDGCYSFEIIDRNGLLSQGCGEGMYYVGDPFGELASGAAFTNSETTRFCLSFDEPGDEDESDCHPATIDVDELIPYSVQDRGGQVFPIAGGVLIDGNTWKAQPGRFEILGPQTVIRGEVRIGPLGEIHGLALINNPRTMQRGNSFRVAGIQDWGVPALQSPPIVEGGGWRSFEIAAGLTLATGVYDYLVLINDCDPDCPIVTSWRNIEICEAKTKGLDKQARPQVQGKDEDEAVETETPRAPAPAPFPNPVTDTVTLPVPTIWHLFNSLGQPVAEGFGDQVPMATLPPGVYLLHDGSRAHKIVKQ